MRPCLKCGRAYRAARMAQLRRMAAVVRRAGRKQSTRREERGQVCGGGPPSLLIRCAEQLRRVCKGD